MRGYGNKYISRPDPDTKTPVQWREEALTKYGGACNHCQIKDFRVLVFDHVYNDGYKGRLTGGKLYKYLATNDLSKRYQILCHNCNHLKERELIAKGKRPKRLKMPVPFYFRH
jgi:hypothetical protein